MLRIAVIVLTIIFIFLLLIIISFVVFIVVFIVGITFLRNKNKSLLNEKSKILFRYKANVLLVRLQILCKQKYQTEKIMRASAIPPDDNGELEKSRTDPQIGWRMSLQGIKILTLKASTSSNSQQSCTGYRCDSAA